MTMIPVTKKTHETTAERDCIYEAETEVALLNENGIMKPHAYQALFAQIAEKHLNKYHVNIDDTMKYGFAWALVSLVIEIDSPVKSCEPLYANTWHSQHKGPYFRRELEFKNASGETVFKGSTFSILLDYEKRSVYRKRELPFPLPDPEEFFTIEASPTMKTKLEFTKVDERRVYNSYIDCVGHVNNCRYAEFAYDAFTDDEKARLCDMKRMEIYFISELRPCDTFSILKAWDGDKMYVRGHNNMKNDTAFDIVLYF